MKKLTSQEIEDGWTLLFDGLTTGGWKNFNEDRICLQDHGSKIWFRNIKIKEL